MCVTKTSKICTNVFVWLSFSLCVGCGDWEKPVGRTWLYTIVFLGFCLTQPQFELWWDCIVCMIDSKIYFGHYKLQFGVKWQVLAIMPSCSRYNFILIIRLVWIIELNNMILIRTYLFIESCRNWQVIILTQ